MRAARPPLASTLLGWTVHRAVRPLRLFRGVPDPAAGVPLHHDVAVRTLKLMERASWDQPLLQELSQTMVDASICGLGQAAPNPALSVMKYFPLEIK